MTALLAEAAAPAPVPRPSPGTIADAVGRFRTAPAPVVRKPQTGHVVPPSVLAGQDTTGMSAALVRDRARFVDCSAGRHVWVELPAHLGAPVCRHCPIRADQAERIRAARRG